MIFFVALSLPSPMQLGHASNTCPFPPHFSHVETCWKIPSGVLTADTRWPCPPQTVQELGVVPAFTPVPLHGCMQGKGKVVGAHTRNRPARLCPPCIIFNASKGHGRKTHSPRHAMHITRPAGSRGKQHSHAPRM